MFISRGAVVSPGSVALDGPSARLVPYRRSTRRSLKRWYRPVTYHRGTRRSLHHWSRRSVVRYVARRLFDCSSFAASTRL